MLGLRLRAEFETGQMRDTAIVFHRSDKSGALDIGAQAFFEMTYPTEDVQHALLAISESQEGRPIVLLGDRGRGKSHILAALHYGFQSPDVVESWAREWGERLAAPRFRDLGLKHGFLPITEAVHNNEYEYVWSLLFDRHPAGQKYLGKWLQTGTPVPPRSILIEMFSEHPTALILDEYQTWFDGQQDEPGDSARKRRSWAFSFTQVLSELARERPDIFILVVSVRNNQTDAYRQVHRDNPLIVDFKGVGARQDRKRLALHRLFLNRRQVGTDTIRSATSVYSEERIRLLYSGVSLTEHDRLINEVVESWPFSPELFDLLEDQILLSEAAQGSRDLIRVLAGIYRDCQGLESIITPADFVIDRDTGGVSSLMDALADEHKDRLREIAQRNLDELETNGTCLPHAGAIISAIWLRSISPGRKVGAAPTQLHLDLTHDTRIDDNAFADELALVQENSFNIHRITAGDIMLRFMVEENAESRLKSHARNDKLFADNEDIDFIRHYLRDFLTPSAAEPGTRVVVLGPEWSEHPWEGSVEPQDRPENWEQPVLLVIPELPSDVQGTLGCWLKEHVVKNRNLVRFLLPDQGSKSVYLDREVVIPARAALLSTKYESDPEYKRLYQKFEGELRNRLGERFRRFAIVKNWDFQNPKMTRFMIEPQPAKGNQVPAQIEKSIQENLFDTEAFEAKVKELATSISPVGRLFAELREPPSKPDENAIPFLGETQLAEQLLRVAARGEVCLNVDGTWYGKRPEHADYRGALHFLQQKASRRGKELRGIKIALPSVVGLSTQSTSVESGSNNPDHDEEVDSEDQLGTAERTPGKVEGFQQETLLPPAGSGSLSSGSAENQLIGDGSKGSAKSWRSQLKSGLNLSAEFEARGLRPSDTVSTARLEFSGLTVQELKLLLQRLPPIVKATLEVVTDE